MAPRWCMDTHAKGVCNSEQINVCKHTATRMMTGVKTHQARRSKVNLPQDVLGGVLRYGPLPSRPALATPEVQIHTSSRRTGTCMLASAIHGRLTLLY